MSGSSDNTGKGPSKPTPDATAPKKPSALIDLKATDVSPTAEGSGVKPVMPTSEKPAGTTAATPNKPQGPASVEIKSATVGASAVPPTAKAANAAPAQKPAPLPPKPEKSGGGIGAIASHLFAGIAGGFLALLGADTIGQQLGLPLSSSSMSEMQKRIAAVEEAAKSKAGTATTEVTQKLAAAEARVAKLEELGRTLPSLSEGQSKLSAETKALADKLSKPAPGADAEKLTKLEETLAALSAAAGTDPQKGRIPQLAQITGKLADLEATLNGQMATVRKNVTQDVEARLGQATEAAEQARSGVQRIDRDLSAVKTDAARATQRLEAIDQSLRAVKDEAAGLTAQLKSVARAQDVTSALAPLSTKLTAVEQNLAGVVKSEDDRKTNAERIVLSLELANLKRALDRGGSFASELAAVQKVGGGKLDLKVLDAAKDKGVPTTTMLNSDFRSVAYAIIAADVEPADASVVDKLISGAKSIVRVRKSNADAAETSAEAIAARIDASLKAGQLAQVTDEAKKLSPKARAAGSAWLAKVEMRAAVDKAVADVETQLKTALSGKSTP